MALIIKRSKLPGSGKGLFTTKPISKGSKVIEYRGEIIRWKAYRQRVKEHKDGFLLFVHRNRCIDAYATPQYKARYANDANGLSKVASLKNNCEYIIYGVRCYIVSKRDIKAGEEILVGYGKDYWNCIRFNIKTGQAPQFKLNT